MPIKAWNWNIDFGWSSSTAAAATSNYSFSSLVVTIEEGEVKNLIKHCYSFFCFRQLDKKYYKRWEDQICCSFMKSFFFMTFSINIGCWSNSNVIKNNRISSHHLWFSFWYHILPKPKIGRCRGSTLYVFSQWSYIMISTLETSIVNDNAGFEVRSSKSSSASCAMLLLSDWKAKVMMKEASQITVG